MKAEDLQKTLNEIVRLYSLEEDWADEGESKIDRDCLANAMIAVALSLKSAGEKWNPPSVSPTYEGGVDVYWVDDNERNDSLRCLLFTFLPSDPDVVVWNFGGGDFQRMEVTYASDFQDLIRRFFDDEV